MIHTVIFRQFTLAVFIILAPFAIQQVNAEEPQGNIASPQGNDEELQGNIASPQGNAESAVHSGIVLETIDAANYTYLNIDENGEKYWIAAPQMSVAAGEKVNFTTQMEMTNFTSKTLDRTFDKILFVGNVHLESSGLDISTVTPTPESESGEQPVVPLSPQTLSDEAETYTVEELFAKKENLKGKLVKVHGDVIKVNENIMGKNWVHIKDGTGAEGSNSIVFTSRNASATVGSVVTAQGIVDIDKDFGSGYVYPVLIEESIFVE
ncbi:MAG: hypothetical protein A2W28_04125 [Gammaproteobacteria bacterium RBG_16_51_14]|nr:MAG: hypothetical protein A2W28_04125 [Gammaproteobacteria bacterium RBG_16_51_14]